MAPPTCFHLVLLTPFVVLSAPVMGFAAAFSLGSFNSGVVYDPSSSAGLSDWRIDGIDHLAQHWFWYRIAGVDSREHSFDTLLLNSATPTGTDRVQLNYSRPGYFDVILDINLNGGEFGSGVSGLVEQFAFTRSPALQSGSLEVSFFQYTNLDLRGTPSGDTVLLSESYVLQREGVTDFSEAITPSLPAPTRGDVGEAPLLLAKLINNAIDDLSVELGNGTLVSSSPVDAAYAWQWNISLDNSPVILVNQSIDGEPEIHGVIPEPSAIAILSTLTLVGCSHRAYGWIF